MRTNSLGEAFRLLGEGIAAGGGAPVGQRAPNPFIMNAVNEYAKSDLEYKQKLEGISTKKMALKQADVQYGMAQDAAAVDKAEKQAERSHQESLAAEKELDNFIRENALLEKQYRLRGMENEAEGVRKQVQAAIEAQLQVGIAREKAKFDRGIGLLPGGAKPEIDVFTPPKAGDKETLQFVTPDTKQTIYISPGLVTHIVQQLSIGKSPYDQTLAKVFRDIANNKTSQPEALGKAIADNWDYIRDNLLPAGVYEGIYGQKTGQTVQPAQPTGPVKPTAVKGPDGVTDLDDASKEQVTIDAQTILQWNIEDGKKLKQIKSLYIDRYKAIGRTVPSKDADDYANNIMREWRQMIKAQKDSTAVK
jgi:hypothetical protein